MFDTRVLNAFFTLLRSGLWDSDIDDLSCFPLANDEWQQLFNISKSQTVEGIVYDGIMKLPAPLQPTREILLRWVILVNNIERKNESMKQCIKEQNQFFHKLGIKPILLKGQGISQFYVHANHRVSGDIDWYFKDKKDSLVLLEELNRRNVKVFRSTINNLDFKWRTCEVDTHVKLFDVFSPLAKYKLDNIKNKQFLEEGGFRVNGNNFNTLPPNLNILQVNLHILKHLLLYGIGLRQFCDSAVLYNKMHGMYKCEWLEDIYKDIKVINWIHVLHHFLVHYIGLPKTKLPFPLVGGVSSTWLMEDIISTGNFGFYDNDYAVIKDGKIISRKKKGKRLWQSFKQYFPLAPYEAICYPIVHTLGKFKLKSFE